MAMTAMRTAGVPASHAAPVPASGATAAPAPAVQSVLVVPDVVEDRREDAAGNIISRRYVKGKLLGKGGFAKCFLFTNAESSKLTAGKCVSKDSLAKHKAKQKLLAEIRIHRSLNHKFIVGFESFFEDRANVYIMLEVCPNQTLLEFVRARKRLTEPEARYFTLQLLDATRYLHAHNIIHRDLKLGNLFLSGDMQLRVGDFGLATQLTHREERKRTICGTPNYIAPEILEGKDGHSFEVDTWALGVIVYTMLIGKPPFETSDVKATYKKIRDNNYTFPDGIPISEEARDLIIQVLKPNPSDRPSLDDLARHPWLCGPGAMVPRRVLPPGSTCEPPRATRSGGDMVHGRDVVAEMLSRPIASLLVRQSRSQVPQYAPPTSGDAERLPSHGARLETVPDVSEDHTGSSAATSTRSSSITSRRTPSVDMGEGGSTTDECASVDTRPPTTTSTMGASSHSSASSLRSLRAAVAAATTSSSATSATTSSAPHLNWRTSAAAAAGDEKENAAPRAYGLHPGTLAAKRGLLQPAAIPPPAALNEADAIEDSSESEAGEPVSTRAAHTATTTHSHAHTLVPAAVAGTMATRRGPLRAGSNSTLAPGAGESFDDGGHMHSGAAFSDAPALAPMHRSSSAPALQPAVFQAPPPHATHMAQASVYSTQVARGGFPSAAPPPAPTAFKPLATRSSTSLSTKEASASSSTATASVGARRALGSLAIPTSNNVAAFAPSGYSFGTAASCAQTVASTFNVVLPSPAVRSLASASSTDSGSGSGGFRVGPWAQAPAPTPSSYRAADSDSDADIDMGVHAPSPAAPKPTQPASTPTERPLFGLSKPATTEGVASGSMFSPRGSSAARAMPTSSPTTALDDTLDTMHTYLVNSERALSGGASHLDDYLTAAWNGSAAMAVESAATPVVLPPELPVSARPRTWVTVWLDYTSKYGLGYMLSNGNVGIYFNDSTKVILSASGTGLFASHFSSGPAARALKSERFSNEAASAGNLFEYVDRAGHGRVPVTGPGSLAEEGFPHNLGNDGAARLVASLKQYPTGLEKKVKLLNYFRKCLGEQYGKRRETTRACDAKARESSTPLATVACATACAAASASGCILSPRDLPVASPESDMFASSGTAPNGCVPVCVGSEEEASMSMGSGAENMVFVKKYIRTRRAILFRLSNRVFQAFFYDGASLLVHTEGQAFTVTDQAGGRFTWETAPALAAIDAVEGGASLSSAVDSDGALTRLLGAVKRLRYVRDAIGQLANSSRPGGTDA